MRRIRVLTVVVLIAFMGTLAPGAPAQQIGPVLELTPDSGLPGTMVTADGTGFLPGTPVALFLNIIEGDPMVDGVVDDAGRFSLRFPIPDVPPRRHQVIACNPYSPSALFCPDQAQAFLRVLPPPTTTTSPPQQTTTTPPIVTETTGPQPTTTSSLSLSGTTTSTTSPPPTLAGDLLFTTTSTSLQIPPAFQDPGDPPFYPDLEITGVEVTQGIQDMQNRMPLVAGKKTLVRVYVGIHQPEPGGGIGGLVGETPPQLIGPEGYSPVDGLLYLQRGSESHFVYADNGSITAFVEGSDRNDPSQTLNFSLPPSWTHGQVKITAFIWSVHPDTALTIESDAGNNFAEGTVVFYEADKPQVLMWRLDPVSTPALDDAGYQEAIDRATESFQRHHPVDTPNFVVIYPSLGPGPLWGDDEPSDEWDFVDARGEPLDRMKWVYYTSNLSGGVRFIGMIPSDTPRDGAGLASSPVAWSVPNDTTPAHEAAHFYGVKHAPCRDNDNDGVPDEVSGGGAGWVDWAYPHGFPNCSIGPTDPAGYYGTDLLASSLEIYSNDPNHPNARWPWMGYRHPRWTDTYHYCLLGQVYDIPCNPASIGVPPKVLLPPVDCGPAQGNGLQLDLCLAVEPPTPLNLEVGPLGSVALAIPEGTHPTWAIVQVDLVTPRLDRSMLVPATGALEASLETLIQKAKGGELSNRVALRVTDPDGHVLVLIPIEARQPGFEEEDDHADTSAVQPIPWPDGSYTLDLLVDGVVADSLTESASPVVAIDSVEVGPGRTLIVAWSGDDPDGDQLTYTVRWSIDSGATWQVVDTGFPATSATIDADALQLPGGEVHITVIASDGFNSGSDTAGPIAVPTGGPSGFVAGPDTVPQHGTHEITFHANDPEDGPIANGSWASDLDGDLGVARIISTRHLSLGVHHISVTVTDSDGNQAVLSKTVEVEVSDLPAPRPTGAIPEAELILTLGPANLDQFPFDPPPTAEEEPPPPAAESGIPLATIWIALGGLVVLAAGLIWRRTGDRKA